MSEPRLLLLETSGRSGQVALALGNNLLGVRQLVEARRHARDLAPAIGELLKAADWRPLQLDAVIVSRGPGSYTGLRIGIMSAKALAYATGCRLIAVDTFAAIALQAPAEARELDVIADAQQDHVYVQRFNRIADGEAWRTATPLSIVPVLEWLSQRPGSAWVAGPGLRPYEQRLPADCRRVDAAHWDPRTESMLQIGLPDYREGRADDVFALEPLYLRPSSAEEKWPQRG